MATYASVSSAGINSATDIVITKPSGLAVGDMMIAGLYKGRSSGANTITAPAGWNNQESVLVTGSLDCRLTVFTKVADASDVSASDFTFTSAFGDPIGGIIVRLSAIGTLTSEASTSEYLNAGTKSFTGFTPTKANSTYVFFGARGVSSNQSAFDITSVSMATNNPTWTERAEVGIDTVNETHTLAAYTASRPEITATGDFTFNFTDPSVSCATLAVVVAVSPQINSVVTNPVTKANVYAITPILPVVIEANSETPATTNVSIPSWTNPDKPTTTWLNPDK